MVLATPNWGVILEIGLVVLFLVAFSIIGTIFLTRSLRLNYKEVFRYHSKFDIELRKTLNLMSKKNGNGAFKEYENVVVKELPFARKKELLTLIEAKYDELDKNSEENAYLTETFEKLQEIRRIRDGKAIIFNHQLTLFPFNLYSRKIGRAHV